MKTQGAEQPAPGSVPTCWTRLSAALLLLASAFLVPEPAHADVRLPKIFGDHMVLQRERPVRLWGRAAAGERVTVELGDKKAAAVADAGGRWELRISPPAAGGPYEVVVTGANQIRLRDVLVGEVWLCSGQSNMEWPVARSKDADREVATANFAGIRHVKIPHRATAKPLSDGATGGWKVCSPKTVGRFTAAGYFFARELHRELGVPVGLIGCNWGGTRIEPWIPLSGFRAVPALADIAKKLGEYPRRKRGGKVRRQTALALYNGMVSPLVPFEIRGVLWYQGESNNGEGMRYHDKMKALIQGWRDSWKQPELPFYFVQLAPFTYRGDPEQLPRIWEAQRQTLTVPHTGMAVTIDVGNARDIHPRNKQAVGHRLALWALARTYGRDDLVHSGPLYRSMKVEGQRIRITFDHPGTGLVARDAAPLSWFTIAGADRAFTAATAVIDGDAVVVSAPTVKKPLAVRFAWHQTATPNLQNREGLPAAPFRTDGW